MGSLVTVPKSLFSASVAGRVETAGGEVFIKAAPPNSWMAADFRVEASVLPGLPTGVFAPSLLGLLEDEEWVVLCLTVVDGRHPAQPWRDEDLRRVVTSYQHRAVLLDPAPTGCSTLRTVAELIDSTPKFRVWRDVAAGVERGLPLSDIDPWCRDNLPLLAALEGDWVQATRGQALVHFDPRADNQLIHPSGQVWVIDWSRSCRAGAWVDLVTLACSAQGDGHDMTTALTHGSLADQNVASRIDAYLAALAGYWLEVSATPDPRAPRSFQQRSGRGAIELLRRRLHEAGLGSG